MYIKNCWYIVAEPDEIAAGPISRIVMGERLVIYRGEDGVPGILQDRCPHRLIPLSLGTVAGSGIRCRYHGATFSRNGNCIEIPDQSEIPPNLRVKAYPCIERYGYIWGWLGKAGAEDPDLLPLGFAVSGEDAWLGGYGHFESIKADYRIINDNLIDITHAEFVHPESFGGAEVRFYRHATPGLDVIDRGMTFNIEERSVHFRTHARSLGDEGAPFWRYLLAQSRGLERWPEAIDFRMEVSWWAPGYTSFHITVKPLVDDGIPPAEIYNLHALTPETPTTSHYFYRSVRNLGNPDHNDQFTDSVRFIFEQDKPILEGQQLNIGNTDLFDLRPVSLKGDRIQLEARKILIRLADSEAQTV